MTALRLFYFNRVMTIKLISIILIFALSPFDYLNAKSVKKETHKMYSIATNQSIDYKGLFKITHTGYGHRILIEGGDAAFFELRIDELAADKNIQPNPQNIRIFLPLKDEFKFKWKQFEIHVTECNENGPPHDQTVPAKFYIEDTSIKSKE